MAGLRNGMRVQYSVKQKVTEAVEERTGMRWRREGRKEVAIVNGELLL
jgi:hypothetical protein